MPVSTKDKRALLKRGTRVSYGKMVGRVERLADDRTVILRDRDGNRIGAPIDAVAILDMASTAAHRAVAAASPAAAAVPSKPDLCLDRFDELVGDDDPDEEEEVLELGHDAAEGTEDEDR